MSQQKWFRLVDVDPSSAVARGSLLRFLNGSWNPERLILMICETFGDSDFPYSLVRLTGSKSGICPMQLLPDPSPETCDGFNVKWLVGNLNKWIWSDSGVDNVWIRFEVLAPEEFQFGLSE